MRPPPSGYAPLQTSWGAEIVADPAKAIGRSIATTGLHDLAASEALARLVSPGDTVIDAGANVGYMTVLAGMLVGREGRVLSFEPHPELFAVLERNVAVARSRFGIQTFELHQAALGNRAGSARLHVPGAFAANDGLSSIRPGMPEGSRALDVRMVTVDEVLAAARPVVLKLDVEGFEAQVLRGAQQALSRRQIKHVVFEDHGIAESEAARLLAEAGYRTFTLDWALRGLRLGEVGAEGPGRGYEPPGFIASLAPDEVVARCAARGWRVLRAATMRRTRP